MQLQVIETHWKDRNFHHHVGKGLPFNSSRKASNHTTQNKKGR
jgi:hypothetical protein